MIRLTSGSIQPAPVHQMTIPEMVEIGDHLQELADDDGAPR